MDAVEPKEHTFLSSAGTTAASTAKEGFLGAIKGAGVGALLMGGTIAVVTGGLAALAVGALGAGALATAAVGVGVGAVVGFAPAITGATLGGMFGAPVGAVQGFMNGRDQVRSEELQAQLLNARVEGFKAQQAAGQALQMQVAQEVVASQNPMGHAPGHHVARLQASGYTPVSAAGHSQHERVRQDMAAQQAGQVQVG